MNSQNPKLLLLVEDDAIIAMDEQNELESCGYKVITANSGQAAIDIFMTNKSIDLVLMDIDLGKGIDGPQAAEIILKDHNVPILFMSSHTEPEYIKKTEQITSYGYVVKNSGLVILNASIKMAFKLFGAHQKLEQSEEKYRVIFENKGSATCMFGENKIITACNIKFCELSGYSKTEIEGKMKWSDLVDKEDLKSMLEYHSKRTKKTGNPPLNYDFGFITKSGERKYVNLNIGMFGSQRIVSLIDITKRKLAEFNLELNNSQLQYLLNATNDEFILMNCEGTIVKINDKAASEYGHKPDELIGKSPFEFMPAKTKARRKKILEVISKDKKPMLFEDENMGKYYHNSLIPILKDSGELLYIALFAQDITSSKKSDLALLETKNRLQSIFNNATDGILQITKTAKIVDANPAFSTLTGIDRKDVIGKSGFVLAKKFVNIKDLPATLKIITDFVKNKQVRNFELKYLDKVFEINTSKKQVNGEHVATIRDITKHKQAKDKISQLLNEKEILLQEVHHRVKNNINVISSLLRMKSQSVNIPELTEAFHDSIGRIQSMGILYDKLFQSAKYQEVSIKEYFPPLVDEILQIFPTSDKIKIKKQFDNLTIPTKDIFPLGIILNELLTNAFKYGFPEQNEGLIKISIRQKQNHVTFIFQDNGIGIPEEKIKKSKGFGLSLIAMLVKQISGNYKIEIDNGTRFIIKFDL